MNHRCLPYIIFLIVSACWLTASGCCAPSTHSGNPKTLSPHQTANLRDSIVSYITHYSGDIGVALIVNNTDTITVCDTPVYPMMSVYKMHQALAICKVFDDKGLNLDSVINIYRDSLNHNTWSPMLKDYLEPHISISVRDLMRYSLIQSDNNASNQMFTRLVSVESTDSLTSTIIPRNTFQISYTEDEMTRDHSKAYANYSSPLGAAIMINRIFTDSLVSHEKQAFIRHTLGECATGTDRISAALAGMPDIKIAHKTGSGYIEGGILVAHNDVAYIKLPNGLSYSLAIFVKDFPGSAAEAADVIAHISAIVYNTLSEIS